MKSALLGAALWLTSAPALAQSAGATFDNLSQAAERARQAGRPDEASRLFREALALNPYWKEGLWYLGGLAYSRGDYSACRERLHQLLKLEPGGSAGWSMLGLCDYEAGQYDAAVAHLRQGQRSGQGTVSAIDSVAKYHLAMLLARGGDYEHALGMYYALAKGGTELNDGLLRAVGIAALRRPYLPEALPLSERDLVLQAGRAFWDVSSGKATEGKAGFEALARTYPAVTGVHYLFGSYLMTVDADRGLAEMQRELALSPRHMGALVTLAVEYLRREETARALPVATEAVRVDPQNFAAHTVLGRILVENGALAKGAAELELAKKLAPDDPQPRVALASAYAKLGRPKEAARERQEFLRLKALQSP